MQLDKREYIRKCIGAVVVNVSDDDLLAFSRLMHSRSARASRLALRFYMMLRDNEYVYFFTQTFSDDYLESVSDIVETFKKRMCRRCFNDYCYNFDYGDLHDRLHVHGLICYSSPVDSVFPDMGGFDLQLITFESAIEERSFVRISRYIAKHAIKSSTKGQSVHYKRNVYKPIDFEYSKGEFLRLKVDFDPSRLNLRSLYLHENGISVPAASLSCNDSNKIDSILSRYNIDRVNFE